MQRFIVLSIYCLHCIVIIEEVELPLLLRAYTVEDGQVDSKLIKDGDAEVIINRFFAYPEVAYIHLRDGESGCYYARIERSA